MFKRINEFLESIPATIVSGIFLVTSFILSKLDIDFIVDPAWVTVFISGVPLLISAIKKLLYNKGISKISSALLITIAMIAAIIIGDLFAAGEVAFIMAIGEILEDFTTNRAKKGLKKLISLAPDTGRIIKDNEEIIVEANKIKVGDILRVLPGEKIPVDGIIIKGDTSIDQSVITGESLPVDRTVSQQVFCGTINCFGVIEIKATKVGSDSTLEKLIRMVKEAESNKAPMARIADKSAAWLVPAALLIAVITGIFTANITRAVTVLVVFCPCALVLATPTAIMAAIGQATKHGVIIKSGEALEKMGKVDIITFDKTGTLTYGKLQVCDILPLIGNTEEDLLSMAAAAEMGSEHPLGKAIIAAAKEKNIPIPKAENFKIYAGRGIISTVADEEIYCGNEEFLKEMGISVHDSKIYTDKLRQEGKATILVAKKETIIGIIALSDVIKEESASVIKTLSQMKTDAILLTGDNRRTAEYFAEKMGIKAVKSQLLPENKVENVLSLQNENHTVCMIGDGVNDAPALKCADVGIAMADMGSDIAIEAADIMILGDDITKIPYLKKLSLSTVKTIKFSIFLSMFINILAVLLSVAGLLNPTTGALVHNAGSCFVILIAALLYDRKF